MRLISWIQPRGSEQKMLQGTEISTVCGACPWADAEEFSLSWDKKFFTSFLLKKKTLGRGQKNIFLLQRIQIFSLCVACP
jgi:hypothetical protein